MATGVFHELMISRQSSCSAEACPTVPLGFERPWIITRLTVCESRDFFEFLIEKVTPMPI